MRDRGGWALHNAAGVEALPATLARPRANAAARALAAADWLIRRKSDGRFLAALRERDAALHALAPRGTAGEDAVPALAARLLELGASRAQPEPVALATTDTERYLDALGVPDDYGTRHGLALVAEPDRLAFAGLDRYRRPLWLLDPAAAAWRRMRRAAMTEGVVLEAISGWRSHAYQLGIFRRKLARGLGVAEILAVNAAPGYSEHHGGCALDIGTPGEPAAEESFERTPAFDWLRAHAAGFGFRMSYPRGNPHGIVYEPWHWCWVGLNFED